MYCHNNKYILFILCVFEIILIVIKKQPQISFFYEYQSLIIYLKIDQPKDKICVIDSLKFRVCCLILKNGIKIDYLLKKRKIEI